MSSQSSVSLVIERGPSRSLLRLFCALFGCAVAGIAVSDVSSGLKAGFLLLLAAGAVDVFRRHILLLDAASVVALNGSGEQWTLHTRDGNSSQAQLAAAACWAFDIVPLVFVSVDGVRRSVLLPPDGASDEALRRLRAWIRHRMPAA